MFTKIISLAFVFSFSLSILFAQNAQDILNKLWENSKANTVKTLYAESKMKMMGMEMQIKRWHKNDNIRIENSFMGQNSTVVITPNSGWINQGGIVQDFPAEQLEQTRRAVVAQNYTSSFPFKSDDISQVEFVGKEKVNDKTCFNLKLTIKGEPEPMNLFIDQNTYEVRKMSQVQDFQGQTKKVDMVIGEYFTNDGFKYPKTIEILVDGENFGTVENNLVQINQEIDDKLFQK